MSQNESKHGPPSEAETTGEGWSAATTAFGSADASRRAIVKTAAKLAYAAPVIAASFGLTHSGALAATRKKRSPNRGGKPNPPKPPKGPTKIALCHATCSNSNPYVYIEIDDNAVEAHIRNHHKHCKNQDIVLGPVANGPFSQADCPGGAIST